MEDDSDPQGRSQQDIQSENLFEQHTAVSHKRTSLKFSFSVLDRHSSRRSFGLSIKDSIEKAIENVESSDLPTIATFESIQVSSPPAGLRDSFNFSVDPNNPDATRPDVKRIRKEDLEVSDSRFKDIKNVYRKPVLHHLQYDDSIAHLGEVIESIIHTKKEFNRIEEERAYVKGKKPFSLLDPITPRDERDPLDLKIFQYKPPLAVSKSSTDITPSSTRKNSKDSKKGSINTTSNRPTPKSSVPHLPPLHGGHTFGTAESKSNAPSRNNSTSKMSARHTPKGATTGNNQLTPVFVDNKPQVQYTPSNRDGVIADDNEVHTVMTDGVLSYDGEDESTLAAISRSMSNEAAYDIILNHRHARFHTNDMDRPLIPASKSLFLYLDKCQKNAHNDYTNAEDDADSSGDELDENSFNINSVGATSTLCTRDSAYTVGFLSEGDLSPRSVYIKDCTKRGIIPTSSIYLGKDFETDLELQHQGIGDVRMQLFASSIVRLDHIHSLNIADNNLTDDGLSAIVDAVANMPCIREFDMSCNTIGPKAAKHISTYLASPDCKLVSLTMRRANIDDAECERFVSALMTNRGLLSLDLSENQVGASENLNTVQPDLVTGGEALGSLLRSENCVLKALKVGWNMIRLDGAVNFANSITNNKTLTYLDLSYNALGSRGGITLGDALSQNRTLQTLYISNNSIDAVACLPICAGILENTELEYVCLDGNPIGEGGSKSLMLLPSMVGSRVTLTAAACNVLIKDPNCWFDPTDILRKFELQLDDPYDRAVAVFLLHLVAEHHTYQIVGSEWYDPASKTTTQLGLVEHVIIDPYTKRLDDTQRDFINNLKMVRAAASDTEKAIKLFHKIDTDGSGQLEVAEFERLLIAIGMKPDEEALHEIFDKYDLDDSGYIDMNEFQQYLKQELKETNIRLRELVEFPVMTIYTKAGMKEKYVPPRTGTLRLNILDGFVQKDTYRVINGSDRSYIMRLARESGEFMKLATYGIQNCRLRLQDAVVMCETLIKESGDKSEVLALVLPQVLKSSDTRSVVEQVLRGNKAEKQKVRREIGALFRPVMGLSDGYYNLDLSNRLDRVCLTKLLEISMTVTNRRKKKSAFGVGYIGDYSQSGNWTCFRNELYNGEPMKISPIFASPIPKTGKLEFDFVCEARPDRDCYAMSDVRFTNILFQNHLIDHDQHHELKIRLHRSRHATDKTVNGDGVTVYECPWDRAQEICNHSYNFYANLTKRAYSTHRYTQKAALKIRMELEPHKMMMTGATFRKYYTIPHVYDYKFSYPSSKPISPKDKKSKRKKKGSGGASEGNEPPPSGITKVSFSAPPPEVLNTVSRIVGHPPLNLSFSRSSIKVTPINTGSDSEEELDIDPEPHRNRSLIENINERESNIMHKIITRMQSYMEGSPADFANRYLCTVASANVPAPWKAIRQLEFILDIFEYLHLFCRQLEMLVDIFKLYGTTPNSEFFGTYRVELVVSLFANVIDLHNFEIVLRALTPYEASCVYCRIGWLHLFNPMKPEGTIELDMSRKEERIVAKMLCKLSTNEPGQNFTKSAFTWEKGKDGLGGFVVTEPWLTEEGMPKRGFLTLQYYSGEGLGLKDCEPNIRLRKAMLQLVLLNEEDIVGDERREHGLDPDEMNGEEFMLANQPMFLGYLAYNEAEWKKSGGRAHTSHSKKTNSS